MAIPRTPLEIRFWRFVDKPDDLFACWLWTGAKANFGHGIINGGGNRGKALRAHRVSWELHYGPIPDGLLVCHHCDVPACVRPDHLFLGTKQENNADCARKGRYDRVKRPKGSRHGMSKLTDDDVRQIRQIYLDAKPTLRSLAQQFGVSLQQIFQIVHRRSWRHLA